MMSATTNWKATTVSPRVMATDSRSAVSRMGMANVHVVRTRSVMYTRLMWCLLGLSLSLSVFSTGCSGDASGILGNAGDDISADAPNTPHGDGILGDASTPVKDVTSALDVTEDSAALPGEMGFPCAGNEDCFSGYCIPGPDGPVCTKACEDDCPMGWSWARNSIHIILWSSWRNTALQHCAHLVRRISIGLCLALAFLLTWSSFLMALFSMMYMISSMM